MKFKFCKLRKFISVIALFTLVIPSWAGSELFKQADQYAKSGDFANMLASYEKIIKDDPKNIRALNGKGTALSWLKKFEDAQEVFIYVLELDPNNIESLNGLGYAYAWNKQFPQAQLTFQHALAIDQNNISARKGLALSNLWAGNYQTAIDQFKPIQKENLNDAEIYSGIGQSHLGLGHTQRAHDSFKQALTIEPNRHDALMGIQATYQQPSKAELGVWYGTSSDGDSGLRLVEGSYWFNKNTKTFLIYDNSLSLDNPTLARNDENADSYELGIFKEFKNQWLGTSSIGYRNLPDQQHQNFYKAEIAKFINANIFKAGAQISPHSEDYTDHVYHFAFGFPISNQLKLEPTLYLSETGGTNDDEWRAVINADYIFKSGWTLNLGAGYGDINSSISDASGSVKVLNTTLTIPIGFHRIHFTGRYEDNPTNDFSVLMVGFTARLPNK